MVPTIAPIDYSPLNDGCLEGAAQFKSLTCGRTALECAAVHHSSVPTACYVISGRHHLVHAEIKVRKGRVQQLVKLFEFFGPQMFLIRKQAVDYGAGF